MTLFTHILGGTTAIALFDTIVGGFTADKTSFIVGAIGAMLPDIDTKRSFIGRLFPPVSNFLENKYGHRTFTHSFPFCLVVSLLVGVILGFIFKEPFLKWSVLFGLGVFSHMALDWTTKMGAQSYYPAKVWCVLPTNRLWRVKTGGRGELFFLIFLIGLFSATFQPSRVAVGIWFKTSFLTVNKAELERIDVEREHKNLGFTAEQLKGLYDEGIISKAEYEKFMYQVKSNDIRNREYRSKYGVPIPRDSISK